MLVLKNLIERCWFEFFAYFIKNKKMLSKLCGRILPLKISRVRFWGKVNGNGYSSYTWGVIHNRVRSISTWDWISRTLKKQYGTKHKEHLLRVFVQYKLVYCPITPSSYQPGVKNNGNNYFFVRVAQHWTWTNLVVTFKNKQKLKHMWKYWKIVGTYHAFA